MDRKRYKIIDNDLYRVGKRVKKIDRLYQVYFDRKLEEYVLTYNGEISFKIGKYLDKRTIDRTFKTNIRNAKSIIESINKSNKNLQESNDNKCQRFASETLKNFIEYADKKGTDCDFSNAFSTKWL